MNIYKLNSAFEHTLHGSPISSFWISTNDSLNQVFQKDHFKNHSVTLKITSHDDTDKVDISERTLEKLK